METLKEWLQTQPIRATNIAITCFWPAMKTESCIPVSDILIINRLKAAPERLWISSGNEKTFGNNKNRFMRERMNLFQRKMKFIKNNDISNKNTLYISDSFKGF